MILTRKNKEIIKNNELQPHLIVIIIIMNSNIFFSVGSNEQKDLCCIDQMSMYTSFRNVILIVLKV